MEQQKQDCGCKVTTLSVAGIDVLGVAGRARRMRCGVEEVQGPRYDGCLCTLVCCGLLRAKLGGFLDRPGLSSFTWSLE